MTTSVPMPLSIMRWLQRDVYPQSLVLSSSPTCAPPGSLICNLLSPIMHLRMRLQTQSTGRMLANVSQRDRTNTRLIQIRDFTSVTTAVLICISKLCLSVEDTTRRRSNPESRHAGSEGFHLCTVSKTDPAA